MELLDFYRSLRKYRHTLIIVPLLTLIAAFFIVRHLPDKYVSHTRLTTGIADRSVQLTNENYNQDFKINQEFGNITQLLFLNKIIDQVSYKLALHDLESSVPFHANKYTQNIATRTELRKEFSNKHDQKEGLSAYDAKDKKLNEVLKSMKYDNESVKGHLKVFRVENSDFVSMEFESDNPMLSAFVLNTLSTEFITYYTTIVSANKTRSVTFLDSLLQIKRTALVTQMQLLTDYKIHNKILNLEDQSRSIYTQIADISTKKSMAQKDAAAYSAALRGIDNHFKPENGNYFESGSSPLNQDIVKTKEELKILNDAYIKAGFDPKYKSQIDSVQSTLTEQIYAQTDRNVYSPSTTKENLVNQKADMEVARDIARNSVYSLDKELGSLNSGLQQMVPDAANIEAYESNLEIANKEYTEMLKQYNEASMNASYILPVRQVEIAIPENAAPDKKILLVGFSGIVSLICCLLVFFVIFYFDRSVYSPIQLEASTSLPVLGSLNLLNSKQIDLRSLWQKNDDKADTQIFKNLLRSIRFEIENDLKDKKVLAITSLSSGTGKTLFAISLAYAFSKTNKKVLVIDGNFLNPDISNSIQNPSYLENFLLNNGTSNINDTSITILGNKGGDKSILELASKETIIEIFNQLREIYDVILIETEAFENINKSKAKEWILFADKVTVVIEAGQSMDAAMETDTKYFRGLGSKFSGFVLNKVPTVAANEEVTKENTSRYNVLNTRLIGMINRK